MIHVDQHTRVYLAAGITDMRKSFHGLLAITREALQEDPLLTPLKTCSYLPQIAFECFLFIFKYFVIEPVGPVVDKHKSVVKLWATAFCCPWFFHTSRRA